MVTITLKKGLCFAKTFYKKDTRYRNVYLISSHYIKFKFYFFDLFELYYASKNYITYHFTSAKYACPITSRNKTPIWKPASGPSMESEHPPLRNLKINHKDETVQVAPYKIPLKTLLQIQNILSSKTISPIPTSTP
jgi:hypothetical protein